MRDGTDTAFLGLVGVLTDEHRGRLPYCCWFCKCSPLPTEPSNNLFKHSSKIWCLNTHCPFLSGRKSIHRGRPCSTRRDLYRCDQVFFFRHLERANCSGPFICVAFEFIQASKFTKVLHVLARNIEFVPGSQDYNADAVERDCFTRHGGKIGSRYFLCPRGYLGYKHLSLSLPGRRPRRALFCKLFFQLIRSSPLSFQISIRCGRLRLLSVQFFRQLLGPAGFS